MIAPALTARKSLKGMVRMEIKILATGSKGNCYVVSDGVTDIMIECGIKYTEIVRRLNYNFGNINTVLISHHHADHSLSAVKMHENGFDLVMPEETAYRLCLNDRSGVYTPEPKKQLNVNTLAVVPFELFHCNTDGSDCSCYGYLIGSRNTGEKLLFTTDTAYIKDKFTGLTHIMIETNYSDNTLDNSCIDSVEKRRLKSHMSLDTAVEFLEKTDRSKLKEIYAIHGSENRLDREDAYQRLKNYAEKVVIA